MNGAGMMPNGPLTSILPVAAALLFTALQVVECQKAVEDLQPPSPSYPKVDFKVVNVDHVFLRQDTEEPSSNSSLKAHTQTFYITGPEAENLRSAVNASFGPLTVDAPIPAELLLTGTRILPVLLGRQVRSSSPVVKILFHMSPGGNVSSGSGDSERDGAHCVTAYAFWDTREVRGSCLVTPGGFCVAQLKPEPAWFSSTGRPGSSGREGDATEEFKGNQVEVYFQSRRDPSGQCSPQDSLQRVGVGKGRDSGGSGTPMRRVGRVRLVRTSPGNPTFLRLRLGGAVVVQTSSKPVKATNVATFYVFLLSASTVENFTLRVTVKAGLRFSTARPSDPALWDIQVMPSSGSTPNTVSVLCQRKVSTTAKRGLLEVLQLDFMPKAASERIESQTMSWRLELPGNVKDVGTMRIYKTQRDYVGLAPLVMNPDMLNTAVLTGQKVTVPVKTLAVEADGSVTDVTNSTSCRSTEEDVVKVSEGCDVIYVDGTERRGNKRAMVNFTYGFLSAQLEMSVWTPRLPLTIEVSDPKLSQIKGWRVPVTTGNRRSTWDSEEEEEMRKGRGCMLQYQHSTLRVLTSFTAQAEAGVPPDPLTGAEPVHYFMGPDWKVDVTRLVRKAVRVSNPEVVSVQDGSVLQGRAVGSTTVQVVSPVTSSLLGETALRVVDDKVSVTELGVQLVSGLVLSLQPSPGSSRAIVATATAREAITQLRQEAVVSCWLQFSDGAVVPLELFDRSVYSLTVTTPDEGVATVRRTPDSTFVVAQGEGQGRGALVRAELRICEECQKSKRKSKLAVGTGLFRVNLQSRVGGGESKAAPDGDPEGGASEVVGDLKAVTSQRSVTGSGRWLVKSIVSDQLETTTTSETTTTTKTTSTSKTTTETATSTAPSTRSVLSLVWDGTTRAAPGTASPTTALSRWSSTSPPTTTGPQATPGVNKGEERRRSYGNMLDNPNAPLDTDLAVPKKDPPKPRTPPVIESDLIRTFRSLSDLEISMYALVGVSCVAIFAFILNCASYNLCFRKHKTPILAGPAPNRNPKDHKHDWVWLHASGSNAPPPGVPAQSSTLKREAHGPLQTRASLDSMGHRDLESPLPTISAPPPPPERTATLGRSRSSSQQHFQAAAANPMANRSATLLARPHRNEPLHSPTSKRNQVQFTTFTTLDIKHLAALKKNGVELNWANQQAALQQQQQLQQQQLQQQQLQQQQLQQQQQQQLQLQHWQQHPGIEGPQAPLPDMPWPVVKPLGECQ